ncbi:hypothetical protein OCK74_26330 [Chitinophagaceae bacterium LB-8]|uniref:Uncharacterized protein n=1 Tax=Paraflavisolibacter caeni TaxID=2982496 RepID=A0A9X3B9Y4_9BACT|nr:hypothetical protein [Paraflavisolibacter caeni]MCU7552665.1 hypothetical protein [Paraflavisolibacter caeni]
MKNLHGLSEKISENDKRSIDYAIRRIRAISSDEGSFIQLELLYYEVLSIARTYGNEINENTMLAGLKQIESNEYKHAQERFKTSSQKIGAIQKFRVAIKKELSLWIKA